ncbi:MAG: HupE/UreJ family protein [Methylovulum sp.]|jgi:urease accessory protein|nr:HupE/UreJ family protein [Methylovulum sp.]MCF7997798.1 HupE/UreJ family protein [Methylovulum sp.]
MKNLSTINRIKFQYLSLASLLTFSELVSAHVGSLPNVGFGYGFQHPLFGLDHFLVMLGLGLWASMQKHRFAKRSMVLFLLFMSAGAELGLIGFRFAMIETAILVSLLSVGIILSVGIVKIPKVLALMSISIFAITHGLAHAYEIPLAASGYAYIVGIVSGTAVLLAFGWLMGRLAQRINAAGLIRTYGAITGLIGIWLLFAA